MSNIKIYVYDKQSSIFLHSLLTDVDTALKNLRDNQDYTLLPIPDTSNSWKWEDNEWVQLDGRVIDREIIQSNIWTGIKDKRLEEVTSGVLVKSVNKKFHTDETSAIQYSNVAGMIALNNYEPIQWKVMDNTWVLLTKELFIELQKAMNANTQATYVIAEQHKEAMMLLDDPSNYDFSTGWTNGVIDYN